MQNSLNKLGNKSVGNQRVKPVHFPSVTQSCDKMPFKHYSIHSNEVLNEYFYYNPRDFLWMCCLTDMPACEATVIEIEQQLEDEEDLDFQGLLSDKVVYLRGHWVPPAG